MDFTLESALFVAGLIVGSFLNVCISRIPRDESIVSPGSRCPKCQRPIRWRHNVPVISYLALRGRCAACGERISLRYPAVELLTGILFVAVYVHFGPTWLTVKLCLFCWLVVGLIFMDAETGLLPREFTYSGIVLGLALAWAAPVDSAGTRFLLSLWNAGGSLSVQQMSLLDAGAAALSGACVFYLIWGLYYLVRRRHGIGFGDLALIAMCGAFLGMKLMLFVIFTATLSATICAVLLLGRRRSGTDHDADQESLLMTEIPFGAFLGACSLLAIFAGESAWQAYLNWIASQ